MWINRIYDPEIEAKTLEEFGNRKLQFTRELIFQAAIEIERLANIGKGAELEAIMNKIIDRAEKETNKNIKNNIRS